MSDARLLQYVERAERLIDERKGISDDIKDVYAEAKSVGYDPKTIKWAIQERALNRDQRAERDALRETYGTQLGLF